MLDIKKLKAILNKYLSNPCSSMSFFIIWFLIFSENITKRSDTISKNMCIQKPIKIAINIHFINLQLCLLQELFNCTNTGGVRLLRDGAWVAETKLQSPLVGHGVLSRTPVHVFHLLTTYKAHSFINVSLV